MYKYIPNHNSHHNWNYIPTKESLPIHQRHFLRALQLPNWGDEIYKKPIASAPKAMSPAAGPSTPDLCPAAEGTAVTTTVVDDAPVSRRIRQSFLLWPHQED